MSHPAFWLGFSERAEIPPQLEEAFQAWLTRNAVTDLDHPESRYDYRGAFLAGVERDPASGHFPDTFKQHGHPTFSNESRYALPSDPYAGSWQGETFMPPRRQFAGRRQRKL